MIFYCISRLRKRSLVLIFFFFNDTATTEIYTLSLHDALPISARRSARGPWIACWRRTRCRDRKSTRLNSSHMSISYAVFCLKKKKNNEIGVCEVEKKKINGNQKDEHRTI